MRSALRSQESPIARRNDNSMLGNASCATPNPQETKAETGTRASSAVAASASRTAVPKTIGDWRGGEISLLGPLPNPSTPGPRGAREGLAPGVGAPRGQAPFGG